jgi:putative membrane protein
MRKPISSILKKHIKPDNVNRFWYIYYAVGIIGFTIPFTHNLFRELIGLSILLSLTLMLVFHRPWNIRFAVVSLTVILGGFFIEAAGVNTGSIFGEYRYGNIMGPGLWNTPFLIGLNWWMLIYIVSQFIRHTKLSTFNQLIIGSAIMVGYDIFLESIAINTGMWNWNGHAIPIQNYLAWFIISFIFLTIFRSVKPVYRNPVAETLLVTQFLFFILLNCINQFNGL